MFHYPRHVIDTMFHLLIPPSMTQEEPPASWGARRRKCAGVPTPPAALRVPCPPATLQGTFDPPLGAGPPPLFLGGVTEQPLRVCAALALRVALSPQTAAKTAE